MALFLGAGALPVWAALPEVGKVLSEVIDVRVGKKLPLPPGRWRVETSFQESAPLGGEGYYRKEQPVYVITLANEDRAADIAVLVLEFTDSADVNWQGQPCDTTTANPALRVNTFETTSNSLKVRCNRVFAFANLRGTAQRGAQNSNAWFAKRFATMQERAAYFPVHALMASGYLAGGRNDRVIVNAYANPALHGLDDPSSAAPLFRAIDAAGARAPALREYLKTFAEWFDGYTNAIDNAYLNGRSPGTQVAPAFRFGNLLAGAAGAPPTTTTPLPAAAPAPALPAATQANPQSTPALQAAVAAPAPTAAAVADPRPRQRVHALVIGNAAYPGARLSNPRNDAQAVAERFKRFGFEVSTVLDANRKQMVTALAQFSESARDADLSIVFYAGHGVQVNGVNYLIPIDMDLGTGGAIGVAFEAVSLNTLVESHLPGKAKLVFLDACRDNPLARTLAGTRGGTRGLAAVNAASGTLISYATRDGSTASDGAGSNSPYTTALLAHVDEAEDISIVLRRVRQRVMTSTRGAQEPWEYGSLVGDKLVLSQMARKP